MAETTEILYEGLEGWVKQIIDDVTGEVLIEAKKPGQDVEVKIIKEGSS